MDEEGLEAGNERDDERERYERAREEYERNRIEIEEGFKRITKLMRDYAKENGL
jgi:hypothetical protein